MEMIIYSVSTLCVEKKISNYGFANATDLTCCGERPGAVQKEVLVAVNQSSAQVSSEDDE